MPNGTIITDNRKISTIFINFFTNIGPDLAQKIKKCEDKDFKHYMNMGNNNSMYLTATTDELLRVVSKFYNKTSRDYYGISMSIIKSVIKCIAQPLLHICNTSFTTETFPDGMKTAKIIPLFKSGDRCQVSSFRPVSILPQSSNIVEKLFNARLRYFINKHDI